MNVRIIIDNQEFTNEAQGLPELEERIFRSDELKGFLTEITGSITLIGDAHDYVRRSYRSALYVRLPVQISTQDPTTGVWTRIFSGEIKTENIQFDMIKREAVCELTDLGFFGLIEANRKVETQLGVQTSINGFVIPALPVNNFSFFEVTNYLNTNNSYTGGPLGTITIPPAQGYYTYDVLKFLIDFMTDGRVGFRSDFFDYTNPANFFAFTGIFSGHQIRLPGVGQSPRISWDDLFSDLHKIFNIWFSVEDDGANPIIRIEPYDFFVRQGQNPIIEAEELVEGLDKSILYNKIDVGCSRQDRGFIPQQGAIYHLRESYTTGSDAKEDVTLDLRMNTLIISSNSIKRVLPIQLRGGHELNPFALMRGRRTGLATPFVIEDDANRGFPSQNVGPNMLAVNYTTGLACATGPVAIPDDIINVEQNIFFGGDNYTIFENDDELDQEVFFVCFDTLNEARYFLTDAPNPAAGFPNIAAYNTDISNMKVVQNHIMRIPNTVLTIGAATAVDFNVGLTWAGGVNNYLTPDLTGGGQPAVNPFNSSQGYWHNEIIKFPEDAQTPASNSGDYNPVNGRFTVPPASGGLYGFRAVLNVYNQGQFSQVNPGLFGIAMQQYDSSNVFINQVSLGLFQIPPGAFVSFPIVLDATFNLASGDYVQVVLCSYAFSPITYPASPLTPQMRWRLYDTPYQQGPYIFNDAGRAASRTFFRVMSTPENNKVIATSDPNNVEAVLDDFTGHIEQDQWDLIKSNPYVGVRISFGPNKYITARAKDITRNISSGDSSGVFQRNYNQSNNLLNE